MIVRTSLMEFFGSMILSPRLSSRRCRQWRSPPESGTAWLPLDVADRHQLHDSSAQPCLFRCLGHDVDILVGQPRLLGQTAERGGADMDSALFHVVQQLASTNHLFGLVAAHGP